MAHVTGRGCGCSIGSAVVRSELKGRQERRPCRPGGAHGQHQQPPGESGTWGQRFGGPRLPAAVVRRVRGEGVGLGRAREGWLTRALNAAGRRARGAIL